MKTKAEKFEDFQRNSIDQLVKLNEKLDKLCALAVSTQLLQECISPEGEVRTAEEAGELISESYCAGMYLAEELNSRAKEFNYQRSEFFIDDEDPNSENSSSGDGKEEDDDDEEPPGRPVLSMRF